MVAQKEIGMSKDVWIDPRPPGMPGFGLAQVKAEGTTAFYDFDGFDRKEELARYKALNRRFWHTKKVGREMDKIMSYKQKKLSQYEIDRLRSTDYFRGLYSL